MYSKFHLLLQVSLENLFSYQCLQTFICYQPSLLGVFYLYLSASPSYTQAIFKSPLCAIIYYLSSAVLFSTLKKSLGMQFVHQSLYKTKLS